MKLRHVPQLVLLALVVLFVTLAFYRAWSTITWQRREIGRMREHLVILETNLSRWQDDLYLGVDPIERITPRVRKGRAPVGAGPCARPISPREEQ